jgi:pimeloyl-ACP methyl ester carboxylesterase
MKTGVLRMVAWTESIIEIAATKIHVTRGGKGLPVLVLHRDIGELGRSSFHDELARSADVIVPHHAGWGSSERADWMRSVRDVAVMHRGLLAALGIKTAALIGLGFGGWIAAEMATMAPLDVAKLVLVSPMGVKPPEGDILDQAIISYIDYARAGVNDQKMFDKVYGAEPSTDQLEAWDIAREMCFRIAWKPYMYSQTLPHLLASVKTPTLIVWGDTDRIVPISTANRYLAALPNAKLEVIKACGHCVDLEQPERLAELVTPFIAR